MLAFQDAGWSGWLSFLFFYAVACLFFVPGSVLAFGAGAIYGFWGGILLALLGNGLSALLSLLITRYLLRDWSARFFARNPTMHDLGLAVQKDGWRIVCLSHLSPIMPFSLVNYAFGLTQIPVGEFLPATLLGGLPASCVYVYLGTMVGNLATIGNGLPHRHPLVWVLQGIGLVATTVLTIYLTRRATQALKHRLPHQTQDRWQKNSEG
jgi:uncharacterized membrane protein YdjX (TVP38/TMEM64 family)